MSDVISFLERMGQDAKLRYSGRAAFEVALEGAAITGEMRSAIVDADARQLEILLGAKSNVCAVIHAVEPDDEEPRIVSTERQ